MKWHLAVQVVKKNKEKKRISMSSKPSAHIPHSGNNTAIQSPLNILIHYLMRFLYTFCTPAPTFLRPEVCNKYGIMNCCSLNLKLAPTDTPRIQLTHTLATNLLTQIKMVFWYLYIWYLVGVISY